MSTPTSQSCYKNHIIVSMENALLTVNAVWVSESVQRTKMYIASLSYSTSSSSEINDIDFLCPYLP